ncbi:MAG: hypothetical protein ACT4P1_08230 [Sporichthyaceae bacterium]
MSLATQRVMAWCGLGLVAFFGAGILVAGFLPPISPDDTAQQVAARYAEDANRIRTGCILMLMGAGFAIPFFAVITLQMRRIHGRLDALALAQLLSGGVAVLVFSVPTLFFAVAAFRPETQDPNVTQALNDVGWFLFLMNVWTVTFQALVIAAAVFTDRRADIEGGEPVFPRWVGYVMVWCALAFIPGGFLAYFKTGPLAWDGVLSFWLAAVFFFGWIVVLLWATVRAVNNEGRAGAPATAATVVA